MAAEKERFIYGNKSDFESGKAKHFVPGCIGNGIEKETAEAVWEKMVKFASYAFNRSHAACYAYIAYITAYMSCHWPVHFYAAMLNAFKENQDKMNEYLFQAKSRGINIFLPNINKSGINFEPDPKNNAIIFGLGGVANVKKAAEAIVREREKEGNYEGVIEFYDRVNVKNIVVNKAAIENLIFAGAFNGFGYNHQQLKLFFDDFIDFRKKHKKRESFILEEDFVPMVVEYDKSYLLKKEYEALGIYLSGHPAEDIYKAAKVANEEHLIKLENIGKIKNDTFVNVAGVVIELKSKFTKNGDLMYTFVLASEFTKINCVVFPKETQDIKFVIREGEAFLIKARFRKSPEYGEQLIVWGIKTLDDLKYNGTLVKTSLDKNIVIFEKD